MKPATTELYRRLAGLEYALEIHYLRDYRSGRPKAIIDSSMKQFVQIAVFLMGSILPVSTQVSSDSPKSLGDVARDSKKEKREQAKMILSDDTQPSRGQPVPDVFYGGLDNTDEILKAIDQYKGAHNLQETEAVVHAWYDKHDAMLANAIEENRRIEQRERDRQVGYTSGDIKPRTQEDYVELQRVELISRREDSIHKRDNGLLSARIQQAFARVRSQVKSKYGMNADWMKIRCGNGNCSY
jgi:hypothetical protein